MKLPNQNPNELAGSEVRPQPPHCDKNSYILESPPFQCCGDFKATESERQPVILSSLSVAQLTSDVHARWVFNTEEISELAVVATIVNDEVSDLAGFE